MKPTQAISSIKCSNNTLLSLVRSIRDDITNSPYKRVVVGGRIACVKMVCSYSNVKCILKRKIDRHAFNKWMIITLPSHVSYTPTIYSFLLLVGFGSIPPLTLRASVKEYYLLPLSVLSVK